MICKFCGAELEEGVTLCPDCGKELAEPVEEKKKSKGWKKVLAIAGVVVLAVVLVGAVLHFMGLGKQVLHTLKFWRANDINYKLSYTVDNAVAEKKVDEVVATLGDQVLTSGELQAHYWMAVYDYLDYYGYYASSMGLDVNKPLNEQIYNEQTGQTFQQMFLANALDSWSKYAALVQLSKDANFTLNADQQGYVDSLRQQVEKLAEEYKYTNIEDFIDNEFFPGSSMDAYMKYATTNYLALSYYDSLLKDITPTAQEIEDYYTKNEAMFTENKVDKSAGYYYDVRHILIGIPDALGSEAAYSDAQWETCLQKAQKMLDDFLAGEATEEAFAKLAKENSQDPGSAENGGLYSQLTKDTGFITGFKDWYLDESRQVGDTGLVKNEESSVQGYHIMYFSGKTPIWEVEAKNAIMTEKTTGMIEEARAKWPMNVDYKKIALGQVNLAG